MIVYPSGPALARACAASAPRAAVFTSITTGWRRLADIFAAITRSAASPLEPGEAVLTMSIGFVG